VGDLLLIKKKKIKKTMDSPHLLKYIKKIKLWPMMDGNSPYKEIVRLL